MSILCAFCLSFTVSVATAAVDVERNRNEAGRYCLTINFSSDQEECLQVVRNAEYISARAAKVCSGATFGSDAVACMKAIKNRDFIDADTERCAKETFGSSRTSCFEKAGKLYQPQAAAVSSISDRDLLSDLRRIERDLRDDRTSRALSDLNHAIRNLERRLMD